MFTLELGAERTPDMYKELLSGPEKPLPSSLPPCVCLEAVNPGLAALENCKLAYFLHTPSPHLKRGILGVSLGLLLSLWLCEVLPPAPRGKGRATISLLPAPDNHHSTGCLYEFYCSRYLT